VATGTEHSVLSSILAGDSPGAHIKMGGEISPPTPTTPRFAVPEPTSPWSTPPAPPLPAPAGVAPAPWAPSAAVVGAPRPAPPSGAPPALGPSAPTMIPGGLQPGPFPPPPFVGGPHPMGSFTSQLQQIDLEEIPDAYKIRGGGWLTPMRAALAAIIAIAVALGVVIGVTRGGGEPVPETVIEIVSSPPGASVTIDGHLQSQHTPTRFATQPGARHLIRLDLPRYQSWQRESAGTDETMIARLEPLTVRLKVTSTPVGADVFLNGAPTGRTPLELQGLDPLTTKVIEVRHRCCTPVRQVLEWGDRELEKTLDFPLGR
jgi:hypothetical protein